MAKTISRNDSVDEEGYIDMELLTSSPSQGKEFEFQMSHTQNDDQETTTSPADELFYKGKLLPLNLLHTSTAATVKATTFGIAKVPFEEDSNYYSMPCTNTANTPIDSCNISPSESCRVSCELNPDDYFFEWSTELSSFVHNSHNHPTKKLWYSKKLKLIKHSIISQKLRASRAYLKSLFTKSACSDESSAKANCNVAEAEAEAAGRSLKRAEENVASSNKYFKIAKKKHVGRDSYPTIAAIIKNMDKDGSNEDSTNNNNVNRRSFSSAIKRHSPAKCLSSSSSSSSSNSSSTSSSFSVSSNNGGTFHELQLLRRSSSATEIEGSIEAAIAHCKKSQQILDS